MALIKINREKSKNIYINGIIESLLEFRVYNDRIFGTAGYSYQYALNELKKRGAIPTNEIETFITIIFGEAEDKENDIEYKLAKILALYILVGTLPNFVDSSSESKNNLKILLESVRHTLKEHVTEYSITFDGNGIFKNYKPSEESVVAENLTDIPQDIVDPIKELLKPMKNEDELIGLFSKVYSEFEKIKKDDLPNLNETDKAIYKRARELAMMVVNKVDKAKGHKGNSELSIKDIAHNFALNASLVQKLININNKKD